jgi:uncharacterized protein (DUF1778 family)
MAKPRTRAAKESAAERTAIINIRVKPEEKARFAKAADEAGMDVSTFMRSATIEKIDRTEMARRPGVLG